MAQKLFDGHEVRSSIQEVGGEGVPERVNAEALVGGRFFQDVANSSLDGPPGQPPSPGIHQQGVRIAGSNLQSGRNPLPPEVVPVQG